MRDRFFAGILVTAVSLLPIAGVIRSASGASCDPPGTAVVTMETSDGLHVAGFVQGTGPLGIVIVHQVNRDHCGWSAETAYLAKRATVLALDLRGYGASASATGTKALAYRNDIAAAVAELRRRGAAKVVLIGASMGASAVIVAASVISPSVDLVVAVSAPGNFRGQNALGAVGALTMPVRFIAAMDDGGAAATASALARRAVKSSDAAIAVFPRGGHGWALLVPGSSPQRIVDALFDRVGP